jgi:hypothetical protein
MDNSGMSSFKRTPKVMVYIFGIAIVLAGVILAVAFTSKGPPMNTTRNPVVGAGSVGILSQGGSSTTVFVATTPNAEAAVSAAVMANNSGVAKQIAAKSVYKVPRGTAAKLVDAADGDVDHISILGGAHGGDEGYVPKAWLIVKDD